MAGPALWSFFPTADTQALLPSSLGLDACYLDAPAGFLSRGKWWWLVCRGLTQNLRAGSCSLQAQEAQLSPRTLWLPPNLMALPLRILGHPGPPSLLQHPSSPPRGGRALPHFGDTPGSSPDLPKPQSPSLPPPRLEVVFPEEQVSPAPCDRCWAQSHCAFRGVKAGVDKDECAVSSAGEFWARVGQGRLLGGGR